jgi:hypothetical protein
MYKGLRCQSQYDCICICILFPVASLMMAMLGRNMYLIWRLNMLCFMGDFRLPSRCSSELHSSGLLRSDYSLCNNPEKCSYPIVFWLDLFCMLEDPILFLHAFVGIGVVCSSGGCGGDISTHLEYSGSFIISQRDSLSDTACDPHLCTRVRGSILRLFAAVRY